MVGSSMFDFLDRNLPIRKAEIEQNLPFTKFEDDEDDSSPAQKITEIECYQTDEEEEI